MRAQLWLTAGERTDRLWPFLAALGGLAPRRLLDFEELSQARETEVVLVCDAEALPREDLGYLRRFLARAGGRKLVIVGEDGSRAHVKSLLRLEGARFLAWPLDVEELASLAGMEPPAPGTTVARPAPRPEEPPAPKTPPTPAPLGPADDEELAEIDAILGSLESRTPARETPTKPARPEGSGDKAPPAADGHALEAPPAYFKDQVADLADIATRLSLALEGLRERAGDELSDGMREQVHEIEGDANRLVQFTRTLSYLVAPPGPGTQVFDLSEMVEVFVSGTASKDPAHPRVLFRGGGALPVRSERALLTQAFDAFLFVAQSSAGAGQIVRVSTKAEGAQCVLAIEFPAGKLADVDPARILEPYGLRRILPDLGPNALAAATGIVAGQGGRALLERGARGGLRWKVELPRHGAERPNVVGRG